MPTMAIGSVRCSSSSLSRARAWRSSPVTHLRFSRSLSSLLAITLSRARQDFPNSFWMMSKRSSALAEPSSSAATGSSPPRLPSTVDIR